MINDMNSHRTLTYNLELNSQDMQRYLAQLENDKIQLKSQVQDWQREADIAKKQVEMERQRCAEMERVVQNERRHMHEQEIGQSSVLRQNDELQ